MLTRLGAVCREMSIQWITKDAAQTLVYWGTQSGQYAHVAAGSSTTYTRPGMCLAMTPCLHLPQPANISGSNEHPPSAPRHAGRMQALRCAVLQHWTRRMLWHMPCTQCCKPACMHSGPETKSCAEAMLLLLLQTCAASLPAPQGGSSQVCPVPFSPAASIKTFLQMPLRAGCEAQERCC